ncbi:FGGY-family carbohydrate kinase [Microbacterium sp. CJ77]|uniref:xylulokinase n=1 Tax=Microbacterium sp. CJ77 TaxID=2079201 RepID=UPI000CD97779|nr:FGGY-family carbohydrate kinase [Microbacterium sp. CJ77]
MLTRRSVLAVDVGTSAVRAAVVTESGSRMATSRRTRPIGETGDTFSPAALWADVVATINGIDPALLAEVAVVSISAHIGQVFLDDDLRPVGVATSWADTRGISQLTNRWGVMSSHFLAQAGRPSLTGGGLAAYLHRAETRPAETATIRWIVSPKDFLIARLTGAVVTDVTTAGYTSASAVRERAWSVDAITAAGVDPALFPPQLEAIDIAGEVTTPAGETLRIPPGTLVAAGGPDGSLGALAVLGGRTDAIADIAGSTDVLSRLITSHRGAPPRAVLNAAPLTSAWSIGGATGLTGGAVSAWAAELGFTDAASYGEVIDAVPIGARGTTVLPWTSGARFPRWQPDSTGTTVSARLDRAPAELFRAAVEGAAFCVREAVDVLDPDTDATIVLAGGLSRSKIFTQLRADVLGREVRVSSDPDASLEGAGLIGLVVAGFHESVQVAAHLARPTTVIAPRPHLRSQFEEAFQAWVESAKFD